MCVWYVYMTHMYVNTNPHTPAHQNKHQNSTEEERKQLGVCNDEAAEPEPGMLEKRGHRWREACLR